MPKYVVRYGVMRILGVFGIRGRELYQRGNRVMTRTNRGMEIGHILCEATEEAITHLHEPTTGQVIRLTTKNDEKEALKMYAQERDEFQRSMQHIESSGLEMQLVDVEHIFGGERIVVYYLAEGRVDFRELVKKMASDFQTRIEMRQIGVRDEAKLLADYGDCGKPVCCNTHLTEMPPVSMKMAKLQRATLDPNKISGRCGRLKCCLRYEYDTYEELHKHLPTVGSEIVTEEGRARVLAQEILANKLLIATEDNRRIMIDASGVLSIISKGTEEDQPYGRRRKSSQKTNNPEKPPEQTSPQNESSTSREVDLTDENSPPIPPTNDEPADPSNKQADADHSPDQ